jgi:hypothetical protein
MTFEKWLTYALFGYSLTLIVVAFVIFVAFKDNMDTDLRANDNDWGVVNHLSDSSPMI